jgi:hypothetical protein
LTVLSGKPGRAVTKKTVNVANTRGSILTRHGSAGLRLLRTLIHNELAVSARKASLTSALIVVDEVDARAAVATWHARTRIHLLVAERTGHVRRARTLVATALRLAEASGAVGALIERAKVHGCLAEWALVAARARAHERVDLV